MWKNDDITITLSQASFTYNTNTQKPAVTVKDGNTTIPASEYTVSYSNNVNVGTATVTITDILLKWVSKTFFPSSRQRTGRPRNW